MEKKKSIIKLTEVEHEEIKQIHHIKMGLIEIVGIADMRKEKFIRRIAKKYKLDVGMVSIDIQEGIIKRR